MKPKDCKHWAPIPGTSTCGGCWNEKYERIRKDSELDPGDWCENFSPVEEVTDLNEFHLKRVKELSDQVIKSRALIVSSAAWGRSTEFRAGYLLALDYVLDLLSSEERRKE